MTPPGAILGEETRALLAVVAGAQTFNDVARLCGWKSRASTYRIVSRLRNKGLVAWDAGRSGTLRPLVEQVG